MSCYLALRSHHPLPISSIPSRRNRSFRTPSFFFATISQTKIVSLDTESIPRHGPTLRRAHPTPPPPPPFNGCIDRESFTRSFDLAALRVPAAECSGLERRLRGHLLNWPRVRNVARVPGDDLDPEFKKLMRDSEGDGGDRLRSLAKRVDGGLDYDEEHRLSPVLYREKLVKDFNYRGFLNFRNLAKMSRPKKKKKKLKDGKEDGLEVKRGVGKNDFAVVEVVGDGGVGEEEDMSGLLGEGFGMGRWRGPTRLLLLDERYAKKGADELPDAIKAVLQCCATMGKLSVAELVQCRLTLFYDYWHMNELLEALLPEDMVVPTGFETVGHIAHLNLRDEHLPYKNLIAQVVLDKNKPKIQTVVNKTDAIQNEYRTMQLEVLAGNHSLVTTVIENGIRLQVDLATVYWNSRLGSERIRLVDCFTSSDVVFNMDGRRFLSTVFTGQRCYPVTQAVMNLPNDAVEFLDVFRGIFGSKLKADNCPLPKIHVYGFSKAENPEFDFHERINIALGEEGDTDWHAQSPTCCTWKMDAVLDHFILPHSVAFAKNELKQNELKQSLEIKVSIPKGPDAAVTSKSMGNMTNETLVENPTLLGSSQNSSSDVDELSRTSSGFDKPTSLISNTTPAEPGKRNKKEEKNHKLRKKHKNDAPSTVSLPDCNRMVDHQTFTDGMENPIHDKIAPKCNNGCSEVILKSEGSTHFSEMADDGSLHIDHAECSDIVVMKNKSSVCERVDDTGNPKSRRKHKHSTKPISLSEANTSSPGCKTTAGCLEEAPNCETTSLDELSCHHEKVIDANSCSHECYCPLTSRIRIGVSEEEASRDVYTEDAHSGSWCSKLTDPSATAPIQNIDCRMMVQEHILLESPVSVSQHSFLRKSRQYKAISRANDTVGYPSGKMLNIEVAQPFKDENLSYAERFWTSKEHLCRPQARTNLNQGESFRISRNMLHRSNTSGQKGDHDNPKVSDLINEHDRKLAELFLPHSSKLSLHGPCPRSSEHAIELCDGMNLPSDADILPEDSQASLNNEDKIEACDEIRVPYNTNGKEWITSGMASGNWVPIDKRFCQRRETEKDIDMREVPVDVDCVTVHEGDHVVSISKHIPESGDGNDGHVSCLDEKADGHSASNNQEAENSRFIGSEVAVQTLDGWDSIGNQPTSIPYCKLKDPKVKLQDVWNWYEKSSSYGLEVKAEIKQNTKGMENKVASFQSHFVPLLSAVQLFGCSRNQGNFCSKMDEVEGTAQNTFLTVSCPEPAVDMSVSDFLDSMANYMRLVDMASSGGKDCCDTLDDPEVIFEYFEHGRPHERKPLCAKIKELIEAGTSNPQVYGDPTKLENMYLQDLHPASWFAVAWYPIYRIPEGTLHAAFLTYHSLGHLILRRIKSDVVEDNAFCAISPVLGMQSYKAKDEGWLDAKKLPESLLKDGIHFGCSKILQERLRTLQESAALYATGHVHKNLKGVSNRHPDYEFFLGRV
ncbi:hypothetical protein J5N97_011836 [Dioscorea zingiberensis]|uniref:SAM-dependent methyltransferase TRM5/TYW2-type domain-containing protein n=1 Tax=Dioscorea zingiberensis TaxID=325984 RepID=A0A9D5HP42_9LILI|nr:hypothetical protein J5N97_011836 [Dioscorea zingiberensis]